MKLFRYTVKGKLAFPLDMLRYDACWPRGGEDAVSIENSLFRNDPQGIRTVTLLSIQRPTEARWASFSWSVDPASIKQV